MVYRQPLPIAINHQPTGVVVSEFNREDVEILDRQIAYRGFFEFRTYRLRHRLYRGGWSEPLARELFAPNDAVGVLLYDPHLDAVALVEQVRIGVVGSESGARHHRSPWLLELVAGVIERGETPEQVAGREAMEEAGTEIQALEPIAEYYSSPGGSNEYLHLFAGRADLRDTEGLYGLAHEHEDIRLSVVPVADLWALLEGGGLINAHALIAVQWLRLHHQRLKQQWA